MSTIIHKKDGPYTKLMLPRELQTEQSIMSPSDHKTVLFKALIVGWVLEHGMPVQALYQRRELGDIRTADLRRPIGFSPYLVEQPD